MHEAREPDLEKKEQAVSAYLVRLGAQGVYLDECLGGGYVGVDYGIKQDLTGRFPDNWRDFNKQFRPVWHEGNPGKSNVAAGLACGAVWTLGRGVEVDDLIVSPTANGQTFHVGRVSGDYRYSEGAHLPHQRPVEWFNIGFERGQMGSEFKRSSGATLSVSNVSDYETEIRTLIGQAPAGPVLVASDPDIEDAAVFAMESHLEDFLVANWAQTELGAHFDIFEEDGEQTGKQYQTDTGPMDILAISHDKKTLLVVELKKGKASDRVVGQVHRYMGYAMAELVEDGQEVRGAVIALEPDAALEHALRASPNVDFYRYEIKFSLVASPGTGAA